MSQEGAGGGTGKGTLCKPYSEEERQELSKGQQTQDTAQRGHEPSLAQAIAVKSHKKSSQSQRHCVPKVLHLYLQRWEQNVEETGLLHPGFPAACEVATDVVFG